MVKEGLSNWRSVGCANSRGNERSVYESLWSSLICCRLLAQHRLVKWSSSRANQPADNWSTHNACAGSEAAALEVCGNSTGCFEYEHVRDENKSFWHSR